jgi:prepilin-type N-terminal cleavage/methylation domain-containing protein
MTIRPHHRGFTLIELAVVVVIVGVLSVLAVVGYRKMIDSSHTTEGSQLVQAVRVAQETYHSETGRYHNVGWSTFCPNNATTPPSRMKHPWNPGCNGGTATWQALPVRTDGPIMFGLVTQAGTIASGTATPAYPAALAGSSFSYSGTPSNGDYFLIGAAADIDGSGGANTVVIGSSFTNELMVFNDGQ